MTTPYCTIMKDKSLRKAYTQLVVTYDTRFQWPIEIQLNCVQKFTMVVLFEEFLPFFNIM
jgi:hypothetical protein